MESRQDLAVILASRVPIVVVEALLTGDPDELNLPVAITALGGAEREEESLEETHLVIGEAAECAERIAAYREMGIDEIACLMNFGAPPREFAERSLRLFGESIIPHF